MLGFHPMSAAPVSALLPLSEAIETGLGELILEGLAPTLPEPFTGVGELVLTGFAPVLEQVTPGVGELALEGLAPDLSLEVNRFSIASVLGYWHSEYGEDPIIGGDVTIVRGTPAYVRDSRGIWRRVAPETLRFGLRPLFDIWAKVAIIERARQNRSAPNTMFGEAGTLGWTKSGDAAATLTVVDDTNAVISAGLRDLVADGMVLELDNTEGVAEARAVNSGTGATVPTTAVHTASVYLRGEGTFDLGLEGFGSGTSRTATSSYQRWFESFSPDIGDRFAVRAAPGTRVLFVLSQLESGAYVTTPIAAPRLASGSAALVSRDGDTAVYADAPLARVPIAVYFSGILGADALDLGDTKLLHVGGEDDPRAFVDITPYGDLRFVVRPGDGYAYEAALPFAEAVREDYVEVVAWVQNNQLHIIAAIRGEMTSASVNPPSGSVHGDTFAAIEDEWSARQIWIGMGPTEVDRSTIMPVAWKLLRANHLNRANLDPFDAEAVMEQCRRIIVGPGVTPLGTGESE